VTKSRRANKEPRRAGKLVAVTVAAAIGAASLSSCAFLTGKHGRYEITYQSNDMSQVMRVAPSSIPNLATFLDRGAKPVYLKTNAAGDGTDPDLDCWYLQQPDGTFISPDESSDGTATIVCGAPDPDTWVKAQVTQDKDGNLVAPKSASAFTKLGLEEFLAIRPDSSLSASKNAS